MTDVTQVPSHANVVLSRLTAQFIGKENITKLAAIVGDELDEVETALFALLNERSLRVAVGAQLDVIGNILNLRRAGMTDAAYRERLRYQIALNTSSGTPDDLISLTKVLTGVTDVQLVEIFPAQVRMTLSGEFPTTTQVNALRALAPVTISPIEILMWGDDVTDTFVFSSTDGPQDDPDGLGFSTTDDLTQGGVMVSIYEVV